MTCTYASLPPGTLLKATWEYRASRPDELSLEIEDVIILYEANSSGWWRGRIYNTEGYFPANYTEPYYGEMTFRTESPTLTERSMPIDGSTADESNEMNTGIETATVGEIGTADFSHDDPSAAAANPAATANLNGEMTESETEDQSSSSGSNVKHPFEHKESVGSLISNSSSANHFSSFLSLPPGSDISPGKNRVWYQTYKSKSQGGTYVTASGLVVPRIVERRRTMSNNPPKEKWWEIRGECILKDLSESEIKRQEIIFELLTTEKDYVRDVDLIIEEQKVLNPKDINVIFSNLEMLLPIHQELLRCLVERRDADCIIQQVGDIFLRVCDYFKMYTLYCSNHPYALMKIQNLVQKPFKQFLEETYKQPSVRNLNLDSFLIKPVQRICKYPLLLRELLRHTPEEHADWTKLNEALVKIQTVVTVVNEAARQTESVHKMIEIQNRFTEKIHFIEPSRKLIKDGEVETTGGDENKKLHLFLFNDLLVIAKVKKDKFQLLHVLSPLSSVSVAGLDDPSDTTFTVTFADDNSKHVFVAASAADGRKWVEVLGGAVEDYTEQMKLRPEMASIAQNSLSRIYVDEKPSSSSNTNKRSYLLSGPRSSSNPRDSKPIDLAALRRMFRRSHHDVMATGQSSSFAGTGDAATTSPEDPSFPSNPPQRRRSRGYSSMWSGANGSSDRSSQSRNARNSMTASGNSNRNSSSSSSSYSNDPTNLDPSTFAESMIAGTQHVPTIPTHRANYYATPFHPSGSHSDFDTSYSSHSSTSGAAAAADQTGDGHHGVVDSGEHHVGRANSIRRKHNSMPAIAGQPVVNNASLHALPGSRGKISGNANVDSHVPTGANDQTNGSSSTASKANSRDMPPGAGGVGADGKKLGGGANWWNPKNWKVFQEETDGEADDDNGEDHLASRKVVISAPDLTQPDNVNIKESRGSNQIKTRTSHESPSGGADSGPLSPVSGQNPNNGFGSRFGNGAAAKVGVPHAGAAFDSSLPPPVPEINRSAFSTASPAKRVGNANPPKGSSASNLTNASASKTPAAASANSMANSNQGKNLPGSPKAVPGPRPLVADSNTSSSSSSSSSSSTNGSNAAGTHASGSPPIGARAASGQSSGSKQSQPVSTSSSSSSTSSAPANATINAAEEAAAEVRNGSAVNSSPFVQGRFNTFGKPTASRPEMRQSILATNGIVSEKKVLWQEKVDHVVAKPKETADRAVAITRTHPSEAPQQQKEQPKQQQQLLQKQQGDGASAATSAKQTLPLQQRPAQVASAPTAAAAGKTATKQVGAIPPAVPPKDSPAPAKTPAARPAETENPAKRSSVALIQPNEVTTTLPIIKANVVDYLMLDGLRRDYVYFLEVTRPAAAVTNPSTPAGSQPSTPSATPVASVFGSSSSSATSGASAAGPNQYAILKTYDDFFDLHLQLLGHFPEEAGIQGDGVRIIPDMPVQRMYVPDDVARARQKELDQYVQAILKLPPKISKSQLLRKFFSDHGRTCAALINDPNTKAKGPKPALASRS